ncbi:hypothetical protein [Streptomyces sp. NPDC048277]|uniref:hypothetical protein n=1 Tax=Streptomyces sp. NPDC048277 TaxID=3155027 RepID=UPI0033E8FA82
MRAVLIGARLRMAAAGRLFDVRAGIGTEHRSEEELREELTEANQRWGSAFERVMLLGGDDAIEAGHELNAMIAEIEWQATGRVTGTHPEWRERYRTAFQLINSFHDAARTDLGIQGNVSGEKHPQRDLLLPEARGAEES